MVRRMRTTVAGLVQIRATTDLTESMAATTAWTRRALEAGAQLVVLPENYCGFGSIADRLAWGFDAAHPGDSEALGPLCDLSRLHPAVWIVAGGVPERAPNQRTYNTLVVLRDGSAVAFYRKIHLFDVELAADVGGMSLRESEHTAPGGAPTVVETDLGRVGLSICYDVRFPELYRSLSAAGAEIIVVPAAFTLHTGMAHWEPLLRARAIENQVWVLAAAQHGIHGGGRHSYGHSMVVDPWGTVIARASAGDGLVLASLRPEVLERARTSLPALSHRTPKAALPAVVVSSLESQTRS
jgi:predicted amidohydrolase